MPYSQSFFGKEITALNYEDIENFFINAQDESDKIEFKSFAETEGSNDKDKENAIIKNICAMLNSEGGIIIWGAPNGTLKPDNTKHKIYQGALSPVTRDIDKDTFIQRVTDGITPSPKGVLFQKLQKGTDFVYILEVGKSEYAPHQFQNLYKMRVDGATITAPHHYIEALFKQIKFPNLNGYIKLYKVQLITDSSNLKKSFVINFSYTVFNFSKLINGYSIACSLVVSKGRFGSFPTKTNTRWFENKQMLYHSPTTDILFYGQAIYNNESIVITEDDLDQNPGMNVNLHFMFGAKNSPLKKSEYIIDFGSFPLGDYDLNKHFTSIKENQTVADINKMSDEEKVKAYLGR